ncbi:pyruvate kinase [Candidatus Uhrbacteria bacterium]|nr:pyruvate kinase [Candidatus Uhrbacteria bacterium]
MRRTKIVCTIGPATEQPAVLQRLIRAGMDVARLNFSHGTHVYHRKLVMAIRAASKAVGKPVAILQDLQGPRIRIGVLPNEGVEVKKGEYIVFIYRTSSLPSPIRRRGSLSSQERVGVRSLPLAYPLYRFVQKGNTLLVDDGKLQFCVEHVRGKVIEAKVVVGGIVRSQKGVNTPGVKIIAPALTTKDKKDLALGLRLGVDFVTLSFVKEAKDVQLLRALIKKSQTKVVPKLVAKLERPEAMENLDAIVGEADAIMIGRGDLALETPPEDVPLFQKRIIETCVKAGKPVIVATQMLESMTENPRPTRAEVSDVANAVIDHTDATMLSGETASGKYPIDAVTMMAKIITETEASRYDDLMPSTVDARVLFSGDAIIVAAPNLLSAIVQQRPERPIYFVTRSPGVARQSLLFWNVRPVLVRSMPKSEAQWKQWIRKNIKKRGRVVLATRFGTSVIS